MWVIVLFDLPTDTKKDIKQYSIFRKKLIQDGFAMFQFSIYIRNCPSRENAQVHINRVKKFLPPKGQIGILSITDKQFGEMEIFISKKEFDKPSVTQQLQLF
jgi:CRISPR-associated protein Cas2